MDDPLRIRLTQPDAAYDAVMDAAAGLNEDGYPGHGEDRSGCVHRPDDPADYRCVHQAFHAYLPDAEAGQDRYTSLDAALDALRSPRVRITAHDPSLYAYGEQHTTRTVPLDATVEADDALLDDVSAAADALPYDAGWTVALDDDQERYCLDDALTALDPAEPALTAHLDGADVEATVTVGAPASDGGPVQLTVTDAAADDRDAVEDILAGYDLLAEG